VLRDGRQPLVEHEWHGHLPKLLLKAIIVHGIRDVPKETIIDDLWPDIEPAAAMQRFKVTLHRLRSALEARIDRRFRWAYVRLKDHLVSLDPELCRIDVVAFQECCTALRAMDTTAGNEQVLALCRKARSLYHGDFLPEEPYLPWIEAKRCALRDDYVQVLGRMAALLEARGQSEEAVAVLSAMVQAAPAREDIVRRLMELHEARGQRRLAMQAYERFRDFLSTDLDVVPDPATTRLYRRLLGRPSADSH
jgi:DNA-binding SARP family transcriptional activator